MKITNAERYEKIKAGIKEIVCSRLNIKTDQGSDKFCLILQKLSNGTLYSWLNERLNEVGIARFVAYYGNTSIIQTALEIELLETMNVRQIEVALNMMRQYGYDLAVDNFQALRGIHEERLITDFSDHFRGKIIGAESITLSDGKSAGVIETLTSSKERKYYSTHDISKVFDKKEYALLYAMFGTELYVAAKSLYITKRMMDEKESE